MMLEMPTINQQFFGWVDLALIQNLFCHCQAIAFSTLLVAHAFKLLLDLKIHCEEKDCSKVEQQTALQRVLIYTSASLTLNNSWHDTTKVH